MTGARRALLDTGFAAFPFRDHARVAARALRAAGLAHTAG